MHELHAHFDCFCLAAKDLKTSSTVAVAPLLDEIDALAQSAGVDDDEDVAAELWLTPQHTHFGAKFSLGVQHDEHDHLFCVCFAASAFNVSSHLTTGFVVSVDGTCAADDSSGFFGAADGVRVTLAPNAGNEGFFSVLDGTESITIGSLNV